MGEGAGVRVFALAHIRQGARSFRDILQNQNSRKPGISFTSIHGYHEIRINYDCRTTC